jgi:hypothetical protein
LLLKIINKIELDLKNFSQKIAKKYVAMATMIVCVKHLFNNPDIFFNSCFKNHFKKWA